MLTSRSGHRAAAAAGPDERLAADLQAAASRARDRSAWFAAGTMLRRSVALTPDPRIRARREIDLARAELVNGHPNTAQQIAHDALMAALNAAMWVGPAETKKIAKIPPPSPAGTAAGVNDLLLAGYRARFTKDYATAAAPLRKALEALHADDLEPVAAMKCFHRGAAAAGSLWDDHALVEITDRWVGITRRLGALPELPNALAWRAITDCLVGRLDRAADHWAEMRELMAASQTSTMFGIDSGSERLLLAYRGDIARARTAGLAQIRESTARGQGTLAHMGRSIVALAELWAGQCEAAVDAALQVINDDPAFIAERTLPTLVEAALRSGQEDVARSAFAILAERTTIAGTPWAHGLRARCQALLEHGSNAEAAYLDAISQLGRSLATVDLARAHMYYGQWLRRAKGRRDARHQLRTAEDLFDAISAPGLAERARSELRATGERARKRTPQTELDLTPQETRVAHLAAEGSTNSEIAQQLFISPSTACGVPLIPPSGS